MSWIGLLSVAVVFSGHTLFFTVRDNEGRLCKQYRFPLSYRKMLHIAMHKYNVSSSVNITHMKSDSNLKNVGSPMVLYCQKCELVIKKSKRYLNILINLGILII